MRLVKNDILHDVRTLLTLLIVLTTTLASLVSCDVHEFPSIPTHTDAVLHLHFDTDLPQTDYVVSRGNSTRIDFTPVRSEGLMRCVVRFYPKTSETSSNAGYLYKEYVTTHDVAYGYDFDMQIDVPVGDYTVMAWADFADESDKNSLFYETDDFEGITLSGSYCGSTDYRDAFRGTTSVNIAATEDVQPAVEALLEMERPLAKFEFVANDLRAFLEQQSKAVKSAVKQKTKDATSKSISLDEFQLVFSYNGYMPCTYNMVTDKPVDAKTGVTFRGKLSQLSEDEASLGFDYVFVNHQATEVTVQLGIYDYDGNLISVSDPVNVPLQRSRHTIVRGAFLTQKSTGGVSINTAYDGDYTIRF